MRKPYQSPGSDEELILLYIAPVGDRTHDLPHTVASNMVKVSHALNHSATEAVDRMLESFHFSRGPSMYGIHYQQSVYMLVVLICSRIE